MSTDAPSQGSRLSTGVTAPQSGVFSDRGTVFDPDAFMFGAIAEHLIRALQPRRILDVGCGRGALVAAFWDRGVEAWGIDTSESAVANVRPDIRMYCRCASVADGLRNCRFDLITCIGVLEHMPEGDALRALGHMIDATDLILFSSSFYHFAEPSQINIRPIMYWLNAFQERGFSPDILFDASFTAPQAMLLRRQDVPLPQEVLRLFVGTLELRCRFAKLSTEVVQANASLQAIETEASALRNQLQTVAALRERASSLEAANAALRAQLDDANITNRQICEDLDVASGHISAFLEREADKNRTLAAGLESRLQTVEKQLAHTAAAVGSILDSRIWHTLVRGGAVIQKILLGRLRNS